MSRRPTLPAVELRRFTGSPRALLALFAVVLVPLIYGGLYTWANESPATRLDQRQAAVVNLDQPVTLTRPDGTEQLVPMGRQVVGKLTGSTSTSNYSWVLTDAAEAAGGLDEGRYAAVLTIPADFSAAATSVNGPPADARSARLQLRTNDAVNYLDGTLGRAIASGTSTEVSRTITESYLGAMYAGYTTLHDQLGSAADGAGKVASGAGDLANGASQAAAGAGKLASGSAQLADGADALRDGAAALATGAGQAASGAAQLASGMSTLDAKAAGLPAGTRQLADGAAALAAGAGQLSGAAAPFGAGVTQFQAGVAQFASGAPQLVSGAQSLKTGAEQLSASAGQLAGGIAPLAAGASQAAQGAAALDAGVTAYTTGVDGLSQACAGSGAAPAFCQQLAGLASQSAGLRTGADGVKAGTTSVSGGLAGVKSGLTTWAQGAVNWSAGAVTWADGAAAAAGGASQLAGAAGQLASGAQGIASGAAQLAPGAAQLSSGVTTLADSMPALSGGIHDLATGTSTLAGKLPALASGASQLADGARKLADGASLSAEGTASLRDGVDKLATGSTQLGSGATDLRDGLQAGVSKIPTYTEAERAALAAAAATPVTADTTRINAVKNNGSGLAPYFMAIALWVGALALYLLLRPLSSRALASSAPSPLVALAGYLPAALLAAVQGVALALVMQYVVGVQAASLPRLVGVAVLAALTFTAMNQALVAMFGTAGRFIAVVLAGLQMTSAGGTYSVQTAPVLFQWLHDVLPLTYAVDAMRKAIAGSSVGVSHDITVLVLTLIGALLLSMYAARRQRTWTITRLHPVVAA